MGDACLSRDNYRLLIDTYKEAPDSDRVSQGGLLGEGKLYMGPSVPPL